MGKGNTIKETIKFLKGIYKVLKDGTGVDTAFKAWFVCKPLIEQCIVPQLQACRSTCSTDTLYYAPDLSVGNPYADFIYHGVIYNDDYHTLTFKVVNNGRGYAWDIGAEASWGHTRNRDGMVSGGGQLFKETIPEMIYAGARNGPPKGVGDYVKDFLIEESNFAKYLQGFKSDADNYDVPAIWYKTIPFTAPEGELTKVIFNVDGNQMITERSETNNTFILTIDKLPTPPSFAIDNFTQKLEDNTLSNFLVDFDIKNNGEENGQATVKIFEDKYDGTNTKTPIYEKTQVVQGLNKFGFSTFIMPDITKSEDYCGKTKKYELVVFDDKGKVDSREFSLPLYSGSVRGSVEDLFGKNVVGATITATSGQTTTVNKYGSYYLKGLDMLGNVTITATHPEFSKTETKVLDFKITNINDPCSEGSLTFNNVNFVLKDQNVMFTVTIKDSLGNLIPARVIASNQDWRFEQNIDDEQTPMPGMQPGKYMFTISAPGYKTISQDVNAVPNNQNLEFTLEKLFGRPDDTGLHLIAPKLLWKKTLGDGERIVSNMKDSKNGKLLVSYSLDNKAKNSNLYFLDLITGNQIKESSVPYGLGYEGFVGLDTSYDGGTVGLNVNLGIKNDNERILKVFDSSGNEFGSTTLSKGNGGSVTSMDVSPDGFYLCTDTLFNKGLHKYTRYETEGKMDYKKGSRESANCGKHFLQNNNIIVGCEGKQEGYCEQTLTKQQVRVIGDTDEGESLTSTMFDSTFNNQTVVVRTFEKLYYLGGSNWNKELESDNMYKSVAVSPGGMYTIVTEGDGALLKLKIFGNTGGDKTPNFPYKNVKYVFANDKGLFFAQVVLNRIEFYQIGEYQSDYNPQTPPPSNTPLLHNNDVSAYKNGAFNPVTNATFNALEPGTIYIANRNFSFDMQDPYGKLDILNGSLFSVDRNHHPVLLKGQMTADFASPTTVYAIKFDRFEMNLFQDKLNQFVAGNLPQAEFFIVQNIHTRFSLKNNPNDFQVAVASGQVKVTGRDIDKTIDTGKQITIDTAGIIKESIYLGWKIYAIVAGVLILISSVLLFVYRKTKIGRIIISTLKKIVSLLWKYLKTFLMMIWKTIKQLLSKIKFKK